MARKIHRGIEAGAETYTETVTVPAATTPRDRLKAFEDEKLGKDCVRIDGAIERGHGSHFQKMSPEDQSRHAALERLVAAHDKVDAAKAALLAAENEAAEAEMAVENG